MNPIKPYATALKTSLATDIDVSVVIAAWNASTFISTAIDSALNQKGVNIEVIVIDDASTDNTTEVVSGYDDERVRLIRAEKNGGPGGARNLGLTMARGTWIAVLDSDDYFLPDRLKNLLAEADEETDVLVDRFLEKKEGDNEITPFFKKNELPSGRLKLSHFIATNLIFTNIKSTGYLKPVTRRAFIEKHKQEYWPDVRIGEDYYFLASCLAKGAKAKVTDTCGYVYTVRTGSISAAMNVKDIEVLLKVDQRFMSTFPLQGGALVAQNYRTRNLIRGLHFLTVTHHLKARELTKALSLMIKAPKASLLLWLPVRKRLLGY